MKNYSYLILAGSLLLLFAFTRIQGSGIQGKVFPVTAADTAIAVLGADTLTVQIKNGNFMFPVSKVGTYHVFINGIPPYTDTTIVNIPVIKDATTDIGIINLNP